MGYLLSLEEIQAILGSHINKISTSIWPIWKRYVDHIPEADRLTFDATAEAKILNRYMIDGIKREFTGVAGTHFLEKYDFMLGMEGFPFGIDGVLVCRFKKLNGNGESRNYPTERAKAIRSNHTTDLEGIPERATIADIGYVQNGLRTGFSDVQAVRVAGTQYVMSFPEQMGGTSEMPLPLPFPSEPRFNIDARREALGGPTDENDPEEDEDDNT